MARGRATHLLIAAAVALALALAAGCGGDEPAPSDEPPSAEAPDPQAEAPAEGEEPSGAARRLLDACRAIAEGAPGVPEDVRRDVIEECEQAAAEDEETLRRAAGAACEVIAGATVPGPLRGPAADACRRALPGVTGL